MGRGRFSRWDLYGDFLQSRQLQSQTTFNFKSKPERKLSEQRYAPPHHVEEAPASPA